MVLGLRAALFDNAVGPLSRCLPMTLAYLQENVLAYKKMARIKRRGGAVRRPLVCGVTEKCR